MSHYIYRGWLLGLLLSLGSSWVFAQVPLEIDRAVKKAIFSQLSDPAYKVGIEYLNTKNKVPSCPGGVEVLLPQNTKIWGRVNLDLRCTNGANWTMNLPVKIVINAEYLVAARYIQGNSRVYAQDLSVAQGDIGELPEGFIQKPEQAIGRQAIRPIQAGGLITLNNLKNLAVIKAGDPVRIQVQGEGFEASGTGTALNAAGINDPIRVKLASGKQAQGRVISEGLVVIKLE
ncbi:flagellar basal body P-ring formation chaperone FlgA [Polynucleobacter sp. MWH-Berg-3C6]|uniref:flagellar basal body P-ring formation chaperone FlgA n=1 Tax=Polynucleobacter sp. MWH-Berg-3C6 TaxID=1855882 RepID=UPI001C0B0454|nr:flagellar basal body P-ring formation chaperone FlgA [Polynucleobacter sp. MWH-Berg-3C6]MBU3550691.1 flagellar basal body P-ring formation protein FlgA [Polynucleobacter sp. MWH-Berg-3C6]